MSKARSRALVLAIWAAGLVPAALLMIWLGYAETSWEGFIKAWVALLALVLAYELVELWAERARLRRRRMQQTQPSE